MYYTWYNDCATLHFDKNNKKIMFNETEEYYEDGYQHGKTDDAMGNLTNSLSNWSFAFQGKETIDSYNNGYKDGRADNGYKDGRADKDDVTNSHHHI